jgi:hypothetical protein
MFVEEFWNIQRIGQRMLTRLQTVPEPPTKRKTLVERAGEPPATTAKSQLPGKAGNLSGFGLRQPGSLLNYRAHNNAPPSSHQNGNRPVSRQANVSRTMAPPRPPSSAENLGNGYDQESDQESSTGSRKGTSTLFSYPGINLRKSRTTSALRQKDKAQSPSKTTTRSQHSGSNENSAGDSGISSKLP